MLENGATGIWFNLMHYIENSNQSYLELKLLLFWVIFQDFAHPSTTRPFDLRDMNDMITIKLYKFSWLRRFKSVRAGDDFLIYWLVGEPFHVVAKAAKGDSMGEQFRTHVGVHNRIKELTIDLWKRMLRTNLAKFEAQAIRRQIQDVETFVKRYLIQARGYMLKVIHRVLVHPMENVFRDLLVKTSNDILFQAQGPDLGQKWGRRAIITVSQRTDAYYQSYMFRFLQRIWSTQEVMTIGEQRVFWGSYNFRNWLRRKGWYNNIVSEILKDSEILQAFSAGTETSSRTMAAGAAQLATDGLAIATFDMDVDEAMADPIMGLQDEVYKNIVVGQYAMVESYDLFARVVGDPSPAQFPVLQIERKITGSVIINVNMIALRLGFQPNMFIREVDVPSESAAGVEAFTRFQLVRFFPAKGRVTEEEALAADLGNEFGMNDITPGSPDEVDVSEGLDVIMSL